MKTMLTNLHPRAHYLGYSSDICRSFFIDPPKQQQSFWLGALFRFLRRCTGRSLHERIHGAGLSTSSAELRAEKLKVWDIVLEAQTAAAAAFMPNHTAAGVDIAARTVIEDAGYGYGFTHRLGHGIGIKGQSIPDHGTPCVHSLFLLKENAWPRLRN